MVRRGGPCVHIACWRRICWTGTLVALLLAGCAPWNRPQPLPPELTEAGVTARLRLAAQTPANQAEQAGRPSGQRNTGEVHASASSQPEPAVYSLSGAIAFAQHHSPRLQSARAAIERSKGQEQAAFAPFLPEVTLASQNGFTTYNQGPGAPGPTGFLEPGPIPGRHDYFQQSLGLIWKLYDFGRRSGRYRQAVALKKITEIQLVRADQTVQFDVATSYLNILLARASLLVQEEAIRQAESTLKDAHALLAGGVATPDNLLRAEVHLSESRDAYVRAQEAKLVATAQLNNVMGRNAALPLKVYDLKLPSLKDRPSLAKSLEIAATQRPEVSFARQAVVAAQENLVAAKAAFFPQIEVRGGAGQVAGNNVITGWQGGAGLHLEVPLYAGGLHRGEVRAARAEVAAAISDAQSILDRISLEVSQTFFSETAARRRLELSRTAVAEARENLRIVRVKYRNSDATPTDIVDAETALTRARQRYNSALYNYLAALAAMDYAMGRQQGTILQQQRAGAQPSPPKAPGSIPHEKVE
jgi:outer membrane protein